MSRSATVVIDGGYYDYITRKAKEERLGESNVDVTKISNRLCDEFDCEHLRTRLYHSYPFNDPNELDDEDLATYRKKEKFFNAVDTEPNHEFVEAGRVKTDYRYDPEEDEYYEDKTQTGTDIKIATDMLDMAISSESDFILLTGDGDMIPAIKQAKRRVSRVYVAYSEEVSVNDRLKQVADDHFDMSLAFLESCQLEE